RRFRTGALHGETTDAQYEAWRGINSDGVFLIDTPGINEVGGEERERLAREVAGRSDLVLFVVEADITEPELEALRRLQRENRPILLVWNKTDRFTQAERDQVLSSLRRRTAGLIPASHIVTAAAEPLPRTLIRVDVAGEEREETQPRLPEVQGLRDRLWLTLEAEGKSLAALNASLFAGRLSDAVAQRVIDAREDLAKRVIHSYCLAKGVLVGINPVPVTDLAAALVVDAGMVVHLSRVYGIPLTRSQAGALVKTISGQMALLMGTVWAVHLVSSILKGGSLGLSALITGTAQGAVAWYATDVVGRAARRYFAAGASWGEDGPKRVVEQILREADRDSLIEEARDSLRGRLRQSWG
ncbi:MAG: YcjF family protein, partial [Gammaproteobacteria bacterium]